MPYKIRLIGLLTMIPKPLYGLIGLLLPVVMTYHTWMCAANHNAAIAVCAGKKESGKVCCSEMLLSLKQDKERKNG